MEENILFANIIIQNRKIRKKFYSFFKIDKTNKTEEEVAKEKNKIKQGKSGERQVALSLWFTLPRKSIILNDIVLEVTPNNFIQLDHLVLTSYGIFLIETKTWSGTYNFTDEGMQSDFSKKVYDVYHQNERHKKLFKQWIEMNFDSKEANLYNDHIQTMIILILGRINKNKLKNISYDQVYDSGKKAATYIKIQPGHNLSYDSLIQLANKIKHAKLLEHWSWIHSNYEIEDMRAVYITGNEKKAADIRQIYKHKGFDVGPLKPSEEESEWYFIVNNHVEITEQHFKNNEKHRLKRLRFPLVIKIENKMLLILFILFILFNYKSVQTFTTNILFASKEVSNKYITQTSAAEQEQLIQVTLNVQVAFKSEMRDDIFFLSKEDMDKYNIEEGNELTVHSKKTSLTLPVNVSSRTESGIIRMQKSIRDKLSIKPDDNVKIKVKSN